MIDYRMVVQTCATLFLGSSSIAWAAGHDMMQPRVPPENMAEARALTSPLRDSSEMIERGKALYNGKGNLCELSWVRGRRRRADRHATQSLTPQLSASWILAPSNGGRNFLGD